MCVCSFLKWSDVFSLHKGEGKPTGQVGGNSAARAGDGQGRQRQGPVTDAEGEQSVLALALRRLKAAAGQGKRPMAIRNSHTARVGGQARYSGFSDTLSASLGWVRDTKDGSVSDSEGELSKT